MNDYDDQKGLVDFAGICFILMAMLAVVSVVYGIVRSIM